MKKLLTLIIFCAIFLLTCCTSTKDISENEKFALRQSKRFAKHIWDSEDVQKEYRSYFEGMADQYRLDKYYKSLEDCKAKNVRFLDKKELRPSSVTFIYRANLSCGDKVIGITYLPKGSDLVPQSIRTIDYSEYSTDPILKPHD